jgi:hypothetical protein
MAAQAALQRQGQQIGLYDASQKLYRRSLGESGLCAGCRAKEARYGFREDDRVERPRTLCFECFRMELDFRQRVSAQLARGWNAQQASLPLRETLNETLQDVTIRRRRAQIAARHALGA